MVGEVIIWPLVRASFWGNLIPAFALLLTSWPQHPLDAGNIANAAR